MILTLHLSNHRFLDEIQPLLWCSLLFLQISQRWLSLNVGCPAVRNSARWVSHHGHVAAKSTFVLAAQLQGTVGYGRYIGLTGVFNTSLGNSDDQCIKVELNVFS